MIYTRHTATPAVGRRHPTSLDVVEYIDFRLDSPHHRDREETSISGCTVRDGFGVYIDEFGNLDTYPGPWGMGGNLSIIATLGDGRHAVTSRQGLAAYLATRGQPVNIELTHQE